MVDLKPPLMGLETELALHPAPSIFSDLTIQLSDRSISCHKIVLYLSCPFLKKLLSSDFKEGQPDFSVLPLLDDNPDAVSALVQYIYHKKFTVPAHLYALPFCLQVFAIAHRFEHHELQGYCGFRIGQAHLREDVPAVLIREAIEQYEGVRDLIGGAVHVKYFKQTILKLMCAKLCDLKNDPDFAEFLSEFPRWNIALLKELHKRWETPSEESDDSRS